MMRSNPDYLRVATGDINDEHKLSSLERGKARQPTPPTEEEEEEEYESIELYRRKVNEQEELGEETIEEDHPLAEIHSIRNDTPHPITRPPTKYRDVLYALAFLAHFFIIFALSFLEQFSLQHTALSYNRAASEASLVMIITLLGGIIGGFLFFILTQTSNYQETILQYGLVFAMIFKICLANILLIMRSYYYWIFGVFLLISLIWDYSRYQNAMKSIPFTTTLIELVIDINRVYGMRLLFGCSLIVATQTCLLLWWGAFFIGLIATIPSRWLWLAMIIMFFSLYWICQVFHILMAFLVGGCTLRLFVEEENPHQQYFNHGNTNNNSVNGMRSILHLTANAGYFNTNANMRSNNMNNSNIPAPPSTSNRSVQQYQRQQIELIKSRVNLYLQCGVTTSFGSICRAGLWMLPSQGILLAKYWILKSGNSFLLSWISCCCCCCRNWMANSVLIILDQGINCFYEQAKRYHKLSISLLAVYGRTLLKTADDHLQQHPESLLSSMEEYSNFLLSCFSSTISAFLAIIFALVSESKQEKTWPIFLLICYLLVYSGISLCLYSLSASIDALIVTAAMNPTKLAEKNQLVLLRFLRLSEVELR